MRKFLVSLFFLISLYFAGSAQNALLSFSKAYFRSDPFRAEFSGFLKHLLNDPDIRNRKIIQRSDTSFFSFSGTYNSYNPFFFKPQRLNILLKEQPLLYADSTIPPDTIFSYELIAYPSPGEKGLREVRKEVEKIHRQYRRRFFQFNTGEIKDGDKLTGEVHNYFLPDHNLAPLSLAWGLLNDELVLRIRLRLKTANNETVLPAPLYNP